ncbi:hypothetical protein DEF50_11055 [Escherichia coli]|nr:hypothetical protein DEF50_11055 [Escherichia coli]EFD0919110.1 hypothetical protein [Escherichia coli]EFN4599096.1 hypothetical protein [Escherichia coli]EFO1120998.1 hypothetical protein [Escherichia coli]EGE2236957.1 hypothetical protein [Escherichia coli]
MKRFAKRCSSSYKILLQCITFLLINPWDYEKFGAGVISLRPLQFIFAVILPHFVVNKKRLRNAILL